MKCTFVTEWPPTSSAPIPCEGGPAGDGVLMVGGIDTPHRIRAVLLEEEEGESRGNAPETEHRLTRMEWTLCSSTKTRLPEREKICRIPSSPRPSIHPVKQSWAYWARAHSVCNMSDAPLHTLSFSQDAEIVYSSENVSEPTLWDNAYYYYTNLVVYFNLISIMFNNTIQWCD